MSIKRGQVYVSEKKGDCTITTIYPNVRSYLKETGKQAIGVAGSAVIATGIAVVSFLAIKDKF